MNRDSHPLVVATICALTLAVFSGAFSSGYVNWDDKALIIDNPSLSLPLYEMLKSSFLGFYLGDYIPFFHLSYWLQNWLLDLTPRTSHVVNLIVHALNVVLLYYWLISRGITQRSILFVVIVFALHPYQVESVMWASERKGLLAAMFLFVALLFYEEGLKNRNSYGKILGLYLMFVFSLLAKTIGVFIPLVLAYDLIFRRSESKAPTKKMYFSLIAMGVSAGFFSVVRIFAQSGYLKGALRDFWDPQRFNELVLAIPVALGHYFQKTFWPSNLSIMYPLYSQMDVTIWQVISFVVLLLAVILLYIKCSHLRRQILFFVFLFFAMLLPVLNIFPRGNFVNDRYMYVPIACLAFLFESFLSYLFRSRILNYSILAGTILVLSLISFNRSAVWQNSEVLWRDAINKNSQSQTAFNNLAIFYKENGRYGEAITALEQALEIQSDAVTPKVPLLMNLGDLYLDKKQLDFYNPTKAIVLYRMAQKLSTTPEDYSKIQVDIDRALLASEVK